MITASNIRRYDNMPFEEYLTLPGYSFSFLKRERSGFAEDMAPTAKIELGKLVDAILCEPGTANMGHEFYPAAKCIAFALTQQFGSLLAFMKKQVSYTGLLTANGWSMPSRGRLDFLLERKAVVDLKITAEKRIIPLIEHMRYWDQQFGYAKLAGVEKRYILIYSRPNKEAKLLALPMTPGNPWWQEKIERFGWPTQTTATAQTNTP